MRGVGSSSPQITGGRENVAPDSTANTSRSASRRRNFTPGFCVAGPPPSRTEPLSRTGTKTVAVVLAGIVTFSAKRPSPRSQRTAIGPRIES